MRRPVSCRAAAVPVTGTGQPPSQPPGGAGWISWNQRLYHQHGVGLWLLTLRDTGEFVGDCGLTPQQVDGVTELEVGYHIRAALQGRGLATEAAAACRDHARDVLRVGRLIAIIDPRNRPSQRVAEKLGLVVERDSGNHGRWRGAVPALMILDGPRASAWATLPAALADHQHQLRRVAGGSVSGPAWQAHPSG
jgi:RimJ/RimL family protein N-acetyltransferase